MSFICKFCKTQMDDCVQCISCLDIFCNKCALHCSNCDTYSCKPCPDNYRNSYTNEKMYCSACEEVLCKHCPYVKITGPDKNVSLKYCLKNDCYKSHIDKQLYKPQYGVVTLKSIFPNLPDYLDKLKKDVDELKAQLEYIPGGEKFKEVQEHFDEIKDGEKNETL